MYHLKRKSSVKYIMRRSLGQVGAGGADLGHQELRRSRVDRIYGARLVLARAEPP